MLDRKWSKYVRDHGRCESCGTSQALTDSHIIGRAYIKTRWDVRNNQCICASEHGSYESQPLLFADFVQKSSCGIYVDTMIVQANNVSAKPDYLLWETIYDTVIEREYSLIEAREWLGQHILYSMVDLSKLD